MISFGRVLRTYVEGGAPVCDVQDEASGAFYLRAQFMCLGGGGGENSQTAHFPPAAVPDASQGVLTGDGARVLLGRLGGGGVVVIGAVMHRNKCSFFSQEEIDASPEAEYPMYCNINDVLLQNGKAFMVLSNFGDAVIDTSQSSRPIRLQMEASPAGHVRISQDGDADERVPLAGPLRNYLDGMAKRMNDIEGRLTHLQAVMALSPAAIPPGLAPAEPALVAFAANISASLSPIPEPVWYPSTDDGMVASAIRVSSRSVVNDEI